MTGRSLSALALRAWLALVFVALFAPLVVMAAMSFNASRYSTLPFHFSTTWYRALAEDDELVGSTWLSIELALVVTLAAAVVGTMLAVWLSRRGAFARVPVNASLIAAVTVPALVLAIAMLLVAERIGLGQSRTSLFLCCLTASLPYVVFIVGARLDAADPALADAARSLGAGPVATFLRVTVPIAFPAILAGSLMAFVICFNNFTVQLFLAPLGYQTLPVEIYTLVRVGVTPDVNALATFIVIGSVVLVVALQLLGGNVARTLTRSPGGAS